MNESSNYKGFNYPLKATVTRIDDPLQLNRIQVYIPAYYGEYNESSLGYGDDLGEYPWAMMCSILFKDTGNIAASSLQDLYAGDLPMIYPAIGTVGWVMFEGGDIRAPIYMGSLSKGEVNETVEGMYQGADKNNLSVTAGSSSLSVIANVIFEQENGSKNYTGINPCDTNGALSIGLLQWNGDNGRELVKRIKNANPGYFQLLYSQYAATFPLEKSWSGYSISNNGANYQALKAILGSTEGIQCQDEYVNEYLSDYVAHAESVGVTDFKAQIYFCDMYNQGPTETMRIARNTTNKTLDGLHSETLNGGYDLGSNKYHNRDRRIRVYNKIKEMDMATALNTTTVTNLQGSLSLETTISYPTDSKTVTVPFIKTVHPKILISEDGIAGKDVRAAHTGTLIAYNDKKNGIWIEITSGKYTTRYYHLLKVNKSIVTSMNTPYSVNVGDIIGYVGNTGDIAVYGLEFELRINGIAIDPIPYLDGISNKYNATTGGVIDTAINFMLNVANDSSHGYSQESSKRWGTPDYDCSSLVISGYRAAGLKLESCTYTGNMKKGFVAEGFTAIPFSASMELIRGDVLLNEVYHTACYIGNNEIVHASSSHGNTQSGDQEGNEILVRSMYIYSEGWDCVLRYTGK